MIKQDNYYNCGIFACMYYLKRYFHLKEDPRVLEIMANTTEENGTSHEGIYDIFNIILGFPLLNFKYNASIKELASNLPAIINYQSDSGGHYAVVTDIDYNNDYMNIWNPATGEHELIFDLEKWARENWYSKLYGMRWFLHIVSKE